jgi:multiple sugar transport system permease protein
MLRRYLPDIGIALGVALLLLWSLGPIYWAVATSLTPLSEIGAKPFHFVPQHFTMNHYARLFGIGNDGAIWRQFSATLFNSIITSTISTVLCVLLAALGGYAFARLEFPGRDALFVLVVATLAIPGYAVLIPLYSLMISLRLIDTYLGITLIYISAYLPLALWMLRSVFQTMPISLEEAAKLDGASRLGILFKIVLPIAAPGLTAVAILTFLGAWGQYIIPLIFSPTLKTKPMTVLIPEFATKNFTDYGMITASGTVAILIPALIVLVLNRYLVSGLLAGSSK